MVINHLLSSEHYSKHFMCINSSLSTVSSASLKGTFPARSQAQKGSGKLAAYTGKAVVTEL